MIKGNVLLAHTGELKKQVSSLSSDSTVLPVTDTFLAKETALRGDIDLFIIDVHFDRSRAIEFVSFIRKIPVYKSTPIFVFKARSTPQEALFRTVLTGLKELKIINELLKFSIFVCTISLTPILTQLEQHVFKAVATTTITKP